MSSFFPVNMGMRHACVVCDVVSVLPKNQSMSIELAPWGKDWLGDQQSTVVKNHRIASQSLTN